MDARSINTLELPKILDRLSKFTAFSASTALALALTPTADLREARRIGLVDSVVEAGESSAPSTARRRRTGSRAVTVVRGQKALEPLTAGIEHARRAGEAPRSVDDSLEQ